MERTGLEVLSEKVSEQESTSNGIKTIGEMDKSKGRNTISNSKGTIKDSINTSKKSHFHRSNSGEKKMKSIMSSSFSGSSFCNDHSNSSSEERKVETGKANKTQNQTIVDSKENKENNIKPVEDKKRVVRLKSMATINFGGVRLTPSQMKELISMKIQHEKEKINKDEQANENVEKAGVVSNDKDFAFKRGLSKKLFSKETILDFNFMEGGEANMFHSAKKNPSTTKHRKSIVKLINENPKVEESSEDEGESEENEDMSKFIHDSLEDILDDIVYYIKRGLNDKAITLIDEHSIHPNEEITFGGSTLLHFSAEHGNIEMFKSLLKRGGSPYVVNSKGEGLIHFAAREGHSDFMRYLMTNHDMDIDQIMNDHWTPLFYACLNNHINVIEYCLETKADMNHVDKYLRTPLHWATKARSPDAVRILLDNNAKYDMKDIEDKTAEQLNEDIDEITDLFVEAETKRQIKLKKQKRNLNVVRNSIKMKKLSVSGGEISQSYRTANSNASSNSDLPKSSRSSQNEQKPKEPTVMKLKI